MYTDEHHTLGTHLWNLLQACSLTVGENFHIEAQAGNMFEISRPASNQYNIKPVDEDTGIALINKHSRLEVNGLDIVIDKGWCLEVELLGISLDYEDSVWSANANSWVKIALKLLNDHPHNLLNKNSLFIQTNTAAVESFTQENSFHLSEEQFCTLLEELELSRDDPDINDLFTTCERKGNNQRFITLNKALPTTDYDELKGNIKALSRDMSPKT